MLALLQVTLPARAQTTGRNLESSRSLGGGTILVRLILPPQSEDPHDIQVSLSGKNQRIPISRRFQGRVLSLQVAKPDFYSLRLEVAGYQPVDREIQPSDFAGSRVVLNIPLQPDTPGKALSDGSKGTVRLQTLLIPKKAQRELEKAVRASDRGKLDKALQHLDKAIEIFPQFHQAFNNRGAAYLRLEDFAQAESDFRESLRLSPDNPTASKNLAFVLVATRRYREAAPLLQSLIDQNPLDAWALTYLGESLFHLLRQDEAEAHLSKALELDSESYLASYRLGAISLARGDKAAALRYWKLFLGTNKGIEDPSIEAQVRKLEEEIDR